MNRCIQPARISLIAMLLMLAAGAASFAESVDRDTVEVIQTLGGSYTCCYDLIVANRQTTATNASEFRLRLITDGARFVTGSSASPADWTIFQQPTVVTWRSSIADADIEPGERLPGFRVCVNDTGVFRMVWETRTIDSVISHDTLAFACRGGNCDEAFFTPIPSSSRCVVDIDLTAGNPLGLVVNDFHLHMLTPVAQFRTDAQPVPQGWVRTRARFDTLMFTTVSRPLSRNQFLERFRIELDAPADSLVRIEWWTTNFGDPICRDTVTFRCGLIAHDTVARSGSGPGDTCCLNLELKNLHLPASPLDGFSLKITTPGARIIGDSAAPGWIRSTLNAAADSMAYILVNDPANGLRHDSSAFFRTICFDNSAAVSDTIRYTWRTYRRGVQVSAGSSFLVCLRPLTRCDSVGARVDSTFPSPQRCIELTLANRNSRGVAVTRFVARISNPGTRRTIRSASAPPGWVVQRFGGDSVVWTGAPLSPGNSLSPFTLCVSLGDGSTGDPLSIAWFTSNASGPLCSDTVRVNANLALQCDTISLSEFGAVDPASCCYRFSFTNRNSRNRTIDRVRLEMVGQNAIFNSVKGPAPWSAAGTVLPSFDVTFTGATVAPGATTPDFTFCLDGSLVPNRPANFDVVWRSYAGDEMVCYDTLHLVCSGGGEVMCDTIPLISQRDSAGVGCIYGFRVVNMHEPQGTVNGVSFRITSAEGVFGDARVAGAAAGWSTIDRQRRSVTFRGASLAGTDSTETFVVRIDSTAGSTVMIEASTLMDDRVICTSLHTVQCAVSGVEVALVPTGLRLSANRPNPFSGVTEISYELLRAGDVAIIIRDERGAEVRRIDRGHQEVGAYDLLLDAADLPSGIYYYMLEAGGERMTRRMVLVK